MGWIGIGAIVYIIIAIGVGMQFGIIAEKKGYNNGSWTAACIFLGLPAWVLVIALPNEKQHSELLAALHKVKTSSAEINNELPDL